MKGQAWNVLETLKTPDHGPLELTRRARVCVWDDLVDVPVVVPLKASSIDIRRKQVRERGDVFDENEEMDISTARASVPQPQHDSLALPSPKFEEVQGNPFNVSRQPSQTDVRESVDINGGPLSPDSLQAFNSHPSPPKSKDSPGISGGYFTPHRPSHLAHKSRMSYEEPRRWRDPMSQHRHGRRFSLGGRERGNSHTFLDEGDDGDLGYAATEDREGNRMRVIVERLESVKSKHPVFTWC